MLYLSSVIKSTRTRPLSPPRRIWRPTSSVPTGHWDVVSLGRVSWDYMCFSLGIGLHFGKKGGKKRKREEGKDAVSVQCGVWSPDTSRSWASATFDWTILVAFRSFFLAQEVNAEILLSCSACVPLGISLQQFSEDTSQSDTKGRVCLLGSSCVFRGLKDGWDREDFPVYLRQR